MITNIDIIDIISTLSHLHHLWHPFDLDAPENMQNKCLQCFHFFTKVWCSWLSQSHHVWWTKYSSNTSTTHKLSLSGGAPMTTRHYQVHVRCTSVRRTDKNVQPWALCSSTTTLSVCEIKLSQPTTTHWRWECGAWLELDQWIRVCGAGFPAQVTMRIWFHVTKKSNDYIINNLCIYYIYIYISIM